ncbi:MAG: hypothetical protein K6G48_03800 [Acholeplasmatales bacterium]|nr:hypothetical protein [Acholeplasmatales bacterium]
MISDYIMAQPEVKMMLDQSFKNNRLSHAYIFAGDKGVGKEAMALYFTALLNSDGEVSFDSDRTKAIFNHDFINLFEISPRKNEIVKEDVEALLREFSKTSLVEGDRVFIIHDADKLNQKTSNMLLKFIEEPPTGVHGILLTANVSNILPTIISRCNIVQFKSKDKAILYKELIEAGMENVDASMIKELTNNKEEGLEILEDDMYNTSKDIVVALLKASKEIDALNIVMENISFLSDQRNMRMVLNMLSLLLEDMLYDSPMRFKDYKDLISRYKKAFENDKIESRLRSILDCIKMIDSNVLSRNIAYRLPIILFR